MNRGAAVALVAVVTAGALFSGKSSGKTSGAKTPGAKPPVKPPQGPMTPAKPPTATSSGVKWPTDAVIGRVAKAIASGDPAKMRAEARKLRAEGWPDQADDLEHAAILREEELKAESHLPQLPSGGAQTSPGLPTPHTTPAPAPAAKPKPKPPAPSAPVPAPATPLHPPSVELQAPRLLKLGMQGDDVKAWQHQLRIDGFDVEVTAEDGIFGPLTQQATKYWQLDHGVSPDGIVGPNTLNAIGKPIKLGARTLRRGDDGSAVRAWKSVLVSHGQTQPMPLSGLFDDVTDKQTRAFQAERALQVDGIVGPKTIAAIESPPVPPVRNASTGKPPLPPSAWRTMRRGTAGDDVKAWQMILVHAGYPISVDGKFGPDTEKATKQWQQTRGLAADGVVGPGTRAKITGSEQQWLVSVGPAQIVAGDLVGVELVATSPLPGVIAAMVPDEEVSDDRAYAAQLALHLSQVNPGEEDRTAVQGFQRLVGLNDTGNYGAATAMAIASYGIIPKRPFFWPRKDRDAVKKRYRDALLEQAARDPQRAEEWQHAANV